VLVPIKIPMEVYHEVSKHKK